MIRTRAAFGIVAALTLAAATAGAAIQPVAQNRSAVVFATVSVGEDFAHDAVQSDAPDFNLFEDTVTVTEELPGTSATADAHHRSDLDESSFFFVGDIFADATADAPDVFSEAFGQSHFNLTFSVDERSILAVYGELNVDGAASAHVNLIGGALSYNVSQSAPGVTSIVEEFVLEPGVEYIFTAHTGGFGQVFDGTDTIADGHVFLNGFVSSVVAVPSAEALSELSAHPNPTRGAVTFEVGDGRGDLSIFDAAGRLVRRLEVSSAVVAWDGRAESGAPAAPGVYFYRVDRGGGETPRRRRLSLVGGFAPGCRTGRVGGWILVQRETEVAKERHPVPDTSTASIRSGGGAPPRAPTSSPGQPPPPSARRNRVRLLVSIATRRRRVRFE